jgi:hypothetical protein
MRDSADICLHRLENEAMSWNLGGRPSEFDSGLL